jgi:hypothetical protein
MNEWTVNELTGHVKTFIQWLTIFCQPRTTQKIAVDISSLLRSMTHDVRVLYQTINGPITHAGIVVDGVLFDFHGDGQCNCVKRHDGIGPDWKVATRTAIGGPRYIGRCQRSADDLWHMVCNDGGTWYNNYCLVGHNCWDFVWWAAARLEVRWNW